MAAALETGRNELESRVRARTVDLEGANSELRSQREELMTQRAELEAQQRELEIKNQEVQNADRLKSEFLANMSHELRTPLNSIIGFSELVIHEAGSSLDVRHRQYLDDVLNSGKHLLAVINDILDLSKIEAGHVALAREPVSTGRRDSPRRCSCCGRRRTRNSLTAELRRSGDPAGPARTGPSCARSC